jgi:hypothetical protein
MLCFCAQQFLDLFEHAAERKVKGASLLDSSWKFTSIDIVLLSLRTLS